MNNIYIYLVIIFIIIMSCRVAYNEGFIDGKVNMRCTYLRKDNTEISKSLQRIMKCNEYIINQ